MSLLSVLRPALLCHRVALPRAQTGRRLAHADPRRQAPVSLSETTLGILVIFTSFLSPGAYVLTHLRDFRRR